MKLKVGDKIRIIIMQGEPQYTGNVGTVEYIDDAGQIHGSWGGCALIPDEDAWELLENSNNQQFHLYDIIKPRFKSEDIVITPQINRISIIPKQTKKLKVVSSGVILIENN